MSLSHLEIHLVTSEYITNIYMVIWLSEQHMTDRDFCCLKCWLSLCRCFTSCRKGRLMLPTL